MHRKKKVGAGEGDQGHSPAASEREGGAAGDGKGAQQSTKEGAGNTTGINGRDEEGERMREREALRPKGPRSGAGDSGGRAASSTEGTLAIASQD